MDEGEKAGDEDVVGEVEMGLVEEGGEVVTGKDMEAMVVGTRGLEQSCLSI